MEATKVELEAGLELDCLVAEKVMGWKLDFNDAHSQLIGIGAINRGNNDVTFFLPEAVPHFSTDIAEAWKVVEKALDYQSATTDIDTLTSKAILHRWELWFGERGSARYGVDYAPTAPLAICRAALMAVNNK